MLTYAWIVGRGALLRPRPPLEPRSAGLLVRILGRAWGRSETGAVELVGREAGIDPDAGAAGIAVAKGTASPAAGSAGRKI